MRSLAHILAMRYCKLAIKGKLCMCVCACCYTVWAQRAVCANGSNKLIMCATNGIISNNKRKQYLLLDLFRLKTALYLYLDEGE